MNEDTTRGTAVMVRGVVILAALAIVSFVLVSRSSAAFTASTDTGGSSFNAGTVDLIDNDMGGAIINVSDMKPGQSTTNCIVVTYQGSIPDPLGVKLYSGGYTDTGNFADFLNVTVEEGSGGTVGNCSGFSSGAVIVNAQPLSTFDTTRTDYATGAGTWDPNGTPQSRTYQVTMQLDGLTPSAQQGEGVSELTLTWEVQS